MLSTALKRVSPWQAGRLCAATLRHGCFGRAAGAHTLTGQEFHLPVVDVAPFTAGTARSMPPAELQEAKLASAKSLLDACTTVGAFNVVGHGLTPDMQDTAFRRAAQFFALSSDDKRRVGTPPHAADGFVRGYIGMGEESGSDLLEVKEAFSYGSVVAGSCAPSMPTAMRVHVVAVLQFLTGMWWWWWWCALSRCGAAQIRLGSRHPTHQPTPRSEPMAPGGACGRRVA